MGVKLTNTNENKGRAIPYWKFLQAGFLVVNKSGVTEDGTRVPVKEVADGPVFFLCRQAARCAAGGQQVEGSKYVFHGG